MLGESLRNQRTTVKICKRKKGQFLREIVFRNRNDAMMWHKNNLNISSSSLPDICCSRGLSADVFSFIMISLLGFGLPGLQLLLGQFQLVWGPGSQLKGSGLLQSSLSPCHVLGIMLSSITFSEKGKGEDGSWDRSKEQASTCGPLES